ncbi:tetratricopeptide repeat protein [Xanthovirga aplysinae]|uniref:tetratricopeptide repeat protein n=1 Tax=Xanthovirga aplysinae TaxID=2529853 RepID=UPI0012BC1814|nr:SAM-dependent methyltransferase [Xanthovirga aplysinae]MTI29645.1 hypothetical protein [Xanthovirga aplysinae]
MRISEKKPFSESIIWDFQRKYYSRSGVNAWRKGEVPHYVTSNSVMGKTYAQLVLAFLKDLSQEGKTKETVYLLELGAGHGRLCYHFFKHFEKLYTPFSDQIPAFCYILSDFAESNISFLKNHPHLKPYVEKGCLDFALFDCTQSKEIQLQHANISIKERSLEQPLIAVGNYFFDSIPQELFYIKNGKLYQGLISLKEKDKRTADGHKATNLEKLQVNYSYSPLFKPPYKETYLNELLSDYLDKFSNTHVLFPYIGIRCLHQLQRLSKKGLLLITADKGYHREASLKGRKAPLLVHHHGCFSLTVNYHAIKKYCENRGGLALFPGHSVNSINLGCLLFLPNPAQFIETKVAYEYLVNDYGPDDYFSIKKTLERNFSSMSLPNIMAALRCSGYDARLFGQMFSRIMKILSKEKIRKEDAQSFIEMTDRIWDMYYPIGERNDLAYQIARLLYQLGAYKQSVSYFQYSMRKNYDQSINVLYHLARCFYQLNDCAKALSYAKKINALDKEHEGALKLLHELGKKTYLR